MSDPRLRRILVPRTVRRLPADLQIVVGYLVVVTAAVVLPVVRETIVRPALALPLLLFVPGYLLVAALFPEAPDHEDGIDGMTRVALSFGTTIAIVPLVGLVLNVTPYGIQLGPVLLSLLGVCGVLLALATRRRAAVDPASRFTVDVRGPFVRAYEELTQPSSRKEAALNVLVVVSVLLAVSSVGYVAMFPKQGEAFTEFYLLTETEDGELVADDYPTEMVRGEPASLVLGIGNHEHESVQYTVVVELQRATVVNESGNETVRVEEQRELRRFRPQVADNETWHRPHTVTPTLTGERLRLVYLLYRGDAPSEPSVDTAYREVHLWVNVSAPSNTARVGSIARLSLQPASAHR